MFKVTRWDAELAIIRVSGRDASHDNDKFIFDIKLILRDPEPKRIAFEIYRGRQIDRWSTTWKRFGRMGIIGDTGIAPKEKFKFEHIESVSTNQKSKRKDE